MGDVGGNAAVQMAEDADLPHIRFGIVQAVDYGTMRATDEQQTFLAFAGAVDLVEDAGDALEHSRGVDPLQVRGAVRALVDGVLANRHSMLKLTGLKVLDKYTFYHSVNVAILSIALGSAISEDEEFLRLLGAGALLHDVGKLVVGRTMLEKAGELTPDEWETMRSHPTAGAQMVSLMPGIDKAVLVPILEHHMGWDGRGYPVRTPLRRQHITSRIVAIADSYDAMTSRRAYSAARTPGDALALIVKDAGSAFDPALVSVFVNLMGAYPPLSMVRLSSGEVAVVLRPSEEDLLRPVVRIIATPEGELVDPIDVELVSRQDLSILSSLDPHELNVAAEDYF